MKTINLILLILISSLLVQCDESENVKAQNDYFPLKDNATWEYQWEHRIDSSEEYLPFSTPLTIKVTGDTIIQDKRYFIMEYEHTDTKFIRKEDNQYFAFRVYDEQEFVFLDTSTPSGRGWVRSETDSWRHEYIMQRPLYKFTVNSKTYYDVLVVEERISDKQSEYSISTFHYYANGVGEILTYYPRTPNSYQNGSKFSLLKSF